MSNGFTGNHRAARELGLVTPRLRLVTDQLASQQGFAHWENCLRAGAIQKGPIWWLPEGGIIFKRHQGGASDNGGLELGLDPLGKLWAVQINEPPVAGDFNRLSSIAVDAIGARFLLRQGWLRPNPQQPANIKDEDFIRRTGLQPTPVEGDGLAARRQWFVVAALNEEPEAMPHAAMSRLVIVAGLKLIVVPIDSTWMRRSLASGSRARASHASRARAGRSRQPPVEVGRFHA